METIMKVKVRKGNTSIEFTTHEKFTSNKIELLKNAVHLLDKLQTPWQKISIDLNKTKPPTEI